MNQIYPYLQLTQPWLPYLAVFAMALAACHGAYRLRLPHLIAYSIAGLLLFASLFADQLLIGILADRTTLPDGSLQYSINQTKAAISMGFQTLGWLTAIAGAYLQISRTRARKSLDARPRSAN